MWSWFISWKLSYCVRNCTVNTECGEFFFLMNTWNICIWNLCRLLVILCVGYLMVWYLLTVLSMRSTCVCVLDIPLFYLYWQFWACTAHVCVLDIPQFHHYWQSWARAAHVNVLDIPHCLLYWQFCACGAHVSVLDFPHFLYWQFWASASDVMFSVVHLYTVYFTTLSTSLFDCVERCFVSEQYTSEDLEINIVTKLRLMTWICLDGLRKERNT